MARLARQLSYTKIYHIIIRGINKQDIFLDNQDRRKFLKLLIKNKEEYKYEIYGHCLMDNHVHIIIKDNENKLSKIMQRIIISYSIYFNKKYERVGHLFQNRFISKVIEDEKYLLTVLRYIHQNPEIAGIEKTNKYNWSSYKEYTEKPKICNTEFILDTFFSNDIESFEKFNLDTSKNNLKDLYEIEGNFKVNDEEAINIIKKETEIDDFSIILSYNKARRDELIKKIKKLNVISNSQLARILGINRKIVDRA